MTGPSLLEGLNPIHWPTLVVVSARVVGLMLVAPLWSSTNVPRSIRSALVPVLSLVLLPVVPAASVPDEWMLLPVPLVVELMVGLAIGFTGAVMMHGVGLAGEVMSLQMGLNMGEALGLSDTPTVTGIGEIKTMLVLTLFVTLNGHLTLLRALADSFAAIPPGGAVDMARGGRALLVVAGTVFETGVRSAAPVIAALLLTNIGLAILSRAVPQLNAMSIAFPVTISVGLVVVGLSLPFFGSYVGRWVGQLGPMAAGTVGAFAPGGR